MANSNKISGYLRGKQTVGQFSGREYGQSKSKEEHQSNATRLQGRQRPITFYLRNYSMEQSPS